MKRDDAATDPANALFAPDPELPHDDADLLADLALLAEPVAPAADGLDRLFASLDAPGPFEHLVGAVADVVAVTREKARALLALIERPERWGSGPRSWVRLLHLDGVGVANAVVGFVEVEAGRTFPHHTHYGDEYVLVLQGRCDDGERVLEAGMLGRMPPESAHGLTAGADEPLVYLAVVFEGLEVDGQPMRP